MCKHHYLTNHVISEIKLSFQQLKLYITTYGNRPMSQNLRDPVFTKECSLKNLVMKTTQKVTAENLQNFLVPEFPVPPTLPIKITRSIRDNNETKQSRDIMEQDFDRNSEKCVPKF